MYFFLSLYNQLVHFEIISMNESVFFSSYWAFFDIYKEMDLVTYSSYPYTHKRMFDMSEFDRWLIIVHSFFYSDFASVCVCVYTGFLFFCSSIIANEWLPFQWMNEWMGQQTHWISICQDFCFFLRYLLVI